MEKYKIEAYEGEPADITVNGTDYTINETGEGHISTEFREELRYLLLERIGRGKIPGVEANKVSKIEIEVSVD